MFIKKSIHFLILLFFTNKRNTSNNTSKNYLPSIANNTNHRLSSLPDFKPHRIMLAIVLLLLSLCAQLGFSAPNRCIMFCDEDQLSAGYIQQPMRQQPVQSSYNFFRPNYQASYPGSIGLAPVPVGGRMQNYGVQPAYGRAYKVRPAHTELLEPQGQVAGMPSNVEGVIYHSSSDSHNSQTHGILRFPGVQTSNAIEYEPIRRYPCKEFSDPCAY